MAATRKLLLSLVLALAIAVSSSLILTFLPGKALATEYDYDIKDLSNGYIEVDGPQEIDYATFAYTGLPVDIKETVYGPEVESDGEWTNPILEYGTDYTLSFRNVEDDSIIPGSPVEIGEYFLVATGIGEYSGSTKTYFEIVDSYDIGECRFKVLPGWDVVMGTVPTFEVYSGNVRLVEGEDYSFEGFFDGEMNPVADFASVAPGYYMAEIAGISPYHGTIGLGIGVYAPNDLYYATIWHDGEQIYSLEVDYTGKPLELDVTVKGGGGSILQEGIDYVLRYFDMDDNPLDSAPVEVGCYWAQFEGLEWGITGLSVSIVESETPINSEDPIPPKDDEVIVNPEGSDVPTPPASGSGSEGDSQLPQTGDATATLAIISSLLVALSATVAAFALRRKMI